MQPEPLSTGTGGDAVREVVTRLLEEGIAVEPPSPGADLLESGLLDSLGLIELLTALEREFEISIDLEDLELDVFRSVDSISLFVTGRLADPDPGEPDKPRLVEMPPAAE